MTRSETDVLQNKNKLEDIKRQSLLASIHEAAKKVVKEFYEANVENNEDIPTDYLMEDGRPKPEWLYDGIHDQISESLIGDTQADDIEPDPVLFPKECYEGQYESGNKWNLLERYFAYEEVERIFYEEWDKLMKRKYSK